MTTPILEPLLAVTSTTPVSAQRETPADERAFRDLLAPPLKRQEEAPPEQSQVSNDGVPPPAVCGAPPASDEASSTDEREEHEEGDARDETDVAVAVVINAAPAIIEAERSTEAEVTGEVVVEVALPTAERDPQTETLPAAVELPNGESLEGETVKVADLPVTVVAETDALETAPPIPAIVDHHEALAAHIPKVDVVNVASDAQAEEVESAAAEADVIPSEQHSTKHVALPQHDASQQQSASSDIAPNRISPNDGDATNSLNSAQQSAELAVPAKRSAGKSRESEKREAKGVGDVAANSAADPPQKNNTLSVAEKPAPTALVNPAVAEVVAESTPNTGVEATPARAEASAVQAAPATAERMGTMLAQRRVKMSASGQGPALTESQQARLVQRVARAFETARMRGDAEIRLRLSPPDLGALKLEVRMESGVMTARLEVETVAAQQALSDNLGTLRQRLAEQNIRVEQFDIDLMDRHNGNPSDSPTSQFNHDERQTQRGAPRTTQTQRNVQAVNNAVAEPRTAARASGGLDVLI